MSLSIGIIGLPNVGKSTVDIANYPFTTINPNIALVPVPDNDLEKLGQVLKPEKITPAAIEFIDIAGLVKEAHLGKGLGNQFLAKIKETDLLLEVVRVFENPDISHIENNIDPLRDIRIIEEELKKAEIKKEIVYVFNTEPGFCFSPPSQYPGLVIPLKEELEISILSKEEKKELEIKDSGLLEKLIETCYHKLDLITFYTVKGGKETRATKIKRGAGILEAAEKIHSDFKERFIRAEVVGCLDLVNAGSWVKAKEKGLVRTEGKEYIVKDKDVIEFKI